MNFQESTTILNPIQKKAGNLYAPHIYIYIYTHTHLFIHNYSAL